jgi:Glycosyltransferase family 87
MMFLKTKHTYLLIAAILVTTSILMYFGTVGSDSQRFYLHGAFGTKDLVMNWASVQLFLAGENPYNATQLLPLVERWGYAGNNAPAAWLPPWAVVLLSSVYIFDFPVVVALWIMLNLGIVCIVTFLLADVYADRKIKFVYLEIAALVFYPLWELLHWGHIGILLSLGFAGTIWALKKEYSLTAGLFMVLFTVKIHVVYLLFAAFFLWIINTEQWKALVGFAGGFSFLVLAAYFRSSSIFEWWFLSFFGKATDYWTGTLVGWIRALLLHFQGYPPKWPMIVIPLFSIAALLYFVYVKRGFQNTEETIHIVACVSVLTAPYAWVYDYAVLLVTQIALVCQTCNIGSTKRIRTEIITSILLINFIAFFLGKTIFSGLHHYFWFPGVLLFLWYRGQSLMKRTVKSTST